MRYQIQRPAGMIDVSRGVIGKIVLMSAQAQSDRLWVATRKGRAVRRKTDRPIFDSKEYIEIQIGESGVDIRLNVIIRFGESIAETTERLIARIHQDLREMAGISAHSVTVLVAGVVSKTVGRRHIEVVDR